MIQDLNLGYWISNKLYKKISILYILIVHNKDLLLLLTENKFIPMTCWEKKLHNY